MTSPLADKPKQKRENDEALQTSSFHYNSLGIRLSLNVIYAQEMPSGKAKPELPSGPVAGTAMSSDYAKIIGKMAYEWPRWA